MSTTNTRSGVVGAVAGGIVAYVLGYVLTYLATSRAIGDSLFTELIEAFGDGGSVPKLVGWVFYNAHFATTTLDVDVPVFGGTATVNFIAESPELSPILYVIPPAMLFGAGLAAIRFAGATETGDALRIGPAVAVGYLPLAVVGTLLFAITVGSSSGQPTLLPAVALTGVVYPFVFGTLGAIAGAAFARGG